MIPAGATLFVSDVHLDSERPELTGRFLDFLERQASRAGKLYILGDLFEYWIGDDCPGDLGETIAAALTSLADSGVPVYFMHGNRDFLLGPDYAAAAGMELLDDPTPLELDGRYLLLSHGDALCTDDIEYQKLRRQVRDPEWQRGFLALDPATRLQQAGAARESSKQYTANADQAIMDVNDEAVAALVASHDSPHLIHGHTHRPNVHRVPDGERRRLVLGAWHTGPSWLWIQGGRYELQPTGHTGVIQ